MPPRKVYPARNQFLVRTRSSSAKLYQQWPNGAWLVDGLNFDPVPRGPRQPPSPPPAIFPPGIQFIGEEEWDDDVSEISLGGNNNDDGDERENALPSHFERRGWDGTVVLWSREDWERDGEAVLAAERRDMLKEKAKKRRRGMWGGMSRAARKRAWRARGGANQDRWGGRWA